MDFADRVALVTGAAGAIGKGVAEHLVKEGAKVFITDLDQGKLDDVSRRMNSSSSHAIFLGVTSSAGTSSDNPDVQSRPLRNLVSYLKQKEAAGVISLGGPSDGGGEVAGVLYCFPPCEFSYGLLQREAPAVAQEEGKDDHLVVLVVCGGAGGM